MGKTKDHQSNHLIVCLIFGLLVGQSTASFKSCYVSRFIFCLLSANNVYYCAVSCLKDCIVPSLENTMQDYCDLGCASAMCVNISTKEDPAEDKVESCVDSCSETCEKI